MQSLPQWHCVSSHTRPGSHSESLLQCCPALHSQQYSLLNGCGPGAWQSQLFGHAVASSQNGSGTQANSAMQVGCSTFGSKH
jgi:hypothetical protein